MCSGTCRVVASGLADNAEPQKQIRRGAVVRALAAHGHSLRFVNGGGTGSLESTAADAVVTELAAGSGLYGPLLFDGYATFAPLPDRKSTRLNSSH